MVPARDAEGAGASLRLRATSCAAGTGWAKASLLDRDLLLLRLAEPLGHHLEELPGDRCVRLDQGPELPRGEPVTGEVGVGDDRRGSPRLIVDQSQFAEVVARAKPASLFSVHIDLRGALASHDAAD